MLRRFRQLNGTLVALNSDRVQTVTQVLVEGETGPKDDGCTVLMFDGNEHRLYGKFEDVLNYFNDPGRYAHPDDLLWDRAQRRAGKRLTWEEAVSK